jgi:phosphoglycerate dehydrogenase-like enzyme
VTHVLCAIGPERAPTWVIDAVEEGGATVAPIEEATALVWFSGRSDGLAALLERGTSLRWVQLATAGVEAFEELIGSDHIWTCAKGIYGDTVAEHALALTLAGFRGLTPFARRSEWSPPTGRNLYGANVTILGGGGIATALIDLLAPFAPAITVVRRTPVPMHGAQAVVAPDDLMDALGGADVVVLALALTGETSGVIGATQLAAMRQDAWIVNVSRGGHIETNALTKALQANLIGGAALDVTDPEPLPIGHPLWTLDNCIITPHSANTPAMMRTRFARLVKANIAAFGGGRPLRGVVNPKFSY